ncbi:WD repeat-containing protein 87 [Podochytrium sp. JEL0797]|nr:WD repeat-containing protein 87 [Podochytrium sp. JEL0797]
MGCTSSKAVESPPEVPATNQPLKWRETEFAGEKWTPIEKLFNLPPDHEVKAKLKAWCKQSSEAKGAKLLETIEAFDDVAKRRAVFQSGQRCGDSLEAGQGVLEANAKSIVDKFLTEGSNKYLGNVLGGEWVDKAFLLKLNLINTTEFDSLALALTAMSERPESLSRSASAHSAASSSTFYSSDLYSSDDATETTLRKLTADKSSTTSISVVSPQSLPPISVAGKSASQTLLAAKQTTAKFELDHVRKPPGPSKGGLEQETPLVFPWKRTKSVVQAMEVTSMRRIEVPGSYPRILAVCSDASIKLLSPVTGATLLTAFPVIKESVINTVEYDIVSNMLWSLTASGDVFVYSTIMNPAKIVDEWKTQVGKDLITCMSAFRTVPKGGKRSLTDLKSSAIYTLFGATDTGQVLTLDIRVHDGLIKLWAISWTDKMDTTSKDAENPDLCLQIIPYTAISTYNLVKMPTGCATHICLNSGSETAAFGSDSNFIHLFNWDAQGFSEMKKRHVADEDHVKLVTFVSGVASLRLFATSSEDGTVKIWDAETNSLIREIQFNEPVTSVCFCNDKSDLLISLPTQLVLLRVHDYLPTKYLADLLIKSDGWADDPIESPKMFDSELDFWELYRLGLEKIGADLSKWHIAFQRQSSDKEKLSRQIEDLERKKHDADEQRKRILRRQKKRRNQLRKMTADEQKQLLISLGMLDSLHTIDLMDLLRHSSKLRVEADPSVLDKYLDDKIEEERRLLFPGKSKTWIQDHFSKLGLIPNSILAGEIEGERMRKERLERERLAAEAVLAMQLAANSKAMADRVKNTKRKPVKYSETYNSGPDLNDDEWLEEGVEEARGPTMNFDEPAPGGPIIDFEELERQKREAEEAERLRRVNVMQLRCKQNETKKQG